MILLRSRTKGSSSMNKPGLKGVPIKLPHILVLTLGFALSLIPAPSIQAAISATDLTAGGVRGNPQSATTQSISPRANQLLLASVASTATPNPRYPPLSANGLTWVGVS